MAEPIFGSGVIVEMLVGASYEPILCGLDCVFTRTPELIETTNPTSGGFKDFAVRREEWGVTVSGLTKVANNAALTFFYMLQTSIRRLKQAIRITFTDIDGADIQISGNVLIGQESISGPSTDFAQCNIELKGSGPFVIADVTPPTENEFAILSDWWPTVNGNNYIDGASSGQSDSAIDNGGPFTLLLTDTILEVDMEGTEFDPVTGTPTVGRREFKFQTSPALILFPSDLIFDGSQRVYVEFKRPV